MKTLLSAALVLSSSAVAQTIECPKLFPPQDIALPINPAGQDEKARVKPAHLSYAYMYFGELFGEQTLVGPEAKRVRGGWDSEYGFSRQDIKWLICRYGGSSWGQGGIERWQKLNEEVTACVLKVREVKQADSTTYWAATAVCK